MYSLYLILCCLIPGPNLEAAAPRTYVVEDHGYLWVEIVTLLQDLPIAKEPVKAAPKEGPCVCAQDFRGDCHCKQAKACGDKQCLGAPVAKEEAKSGKAAYDAAYREAEQGRLPLVVFVGQPSYSVYGAVVCRWDDYPVDTNIRPAVVIGRGGKELTTIYRIITKKKITDFLYPNNVGHDLHMPVPDSFPPGTKFGNGGYIGSDGHYIPPVGRGGLLIRTFPRVYGGR